MRLGAAVIQLLGWMLVWSPWGIPEILSRSTVSQHHHLFLSWSLRAVPQTCPWVKATQLPDQVLGPSLREMAWTCPQGGLSQLLGRIRRQSPTGVAGVLREQRTLQKEGKSPRSPQTMSREPWRNLREDTGRTERLRRRRRFPKEAVAPCQPLPQKRRRREPPARQ